MISAPAAFTSANAALAKRPIMVITIAGYSRVFTKVATGIAGQYPWIESIEDYSTIISDLDGGADLETFAFTVQDRNNLLTADFPGFVFEGKPIQVTTGFEGMAQVDFAILFTGKIDSVASANSNLSYLFTCVDNKQALTKVIYTTGDDGKPTDSDHPRTVNGHPLDILIDVLETQVGIVSSDIGLANILFYRDNIYSGVQFVFRLTSPPAALDFLEAEILKPLGAYLWINNLGQFCVNFMYPTNFTPSLTLDRSNIVEIPEAGQAELINQVNVRFDQNDDGKFLGESVQEDANSIAKYSLFGQQVIESAGLRSAFLGFFLAALVAHLIFLRYGFKALMFDNDVTTLWSACVLEPGDLVLVTHSLVPDRAAGLMGITGQTFEVMDRLWNFTDCTATFKLMSLNLANFRQFLITPNGQPSYTASSTADKATYMFMCNNSDQYSDGSPANTLG